MTSTQTAGSSTGLKDGALNDSIAILDFGSQYSQLIARRVREQNVFSELIHYNISAEELRRLKPKGIILSGGPNSVYDAGAPKCDPEIWKLGVPILGVCYGMQLMVQELGGQVEPAKVREFGRAMLTVIHHGMLFRGLDPSMESWMSHGDSVINLPPGFRTVGCTLSTPMAAIADEERGFYGVQFHPEVVHTRGGQDIIRNFVADICGCTQLDN